MKKRTPVTERLLMHGNSFTASDTVIADYLLKNYPKSLLQNASELSESLDLNIATVTRFFMKLGYGSAKEAVSDFKEELEFIIDSPADRYGANGEPQGSWSEASARHLQQEQENLAKTLSKVDAQTLHDTAELLLDPNKKIFFVGMMKEWSIAFYFYKQLFSLRDNVVLVNEHNVVNRMASISSDSVCVVIDFRRYAKSTKMIAQYAKKAGATIITISDSRFCSTALISDYQFSVYSKSTSIFDSYTAAMSLVSMIIFYIVKLHGDDCKARLSKIEDIYSEFGVFN